MRKMGKIMVIPGMMAVIIILVIAALVCNSLIVQAVWNHLIATALDLPTFSFKVAFGVTLLFYFLFGGSRTVVVRR